MKQANNTKKFKSPKIAVAASVRGQYSTTTTRTRWRIASPLVEADDVRKERLSTVVRLAFEAAGGRSFTK